MAEGKSKKKKASLRSVDEDIFGNGSMNSNLLLRSKVLQARIPLRKRNYLQTMVPQKLFFCSPQMSS